jgi:hypothetical protein
MIDAYMKTAKSLTDLIEDGLDKLQARQEAEERQAADLAEERALGWKAYEDACRAGLPEILRPYLEPFAVPQSNANWDSIIVVGVAIPGLAPIRVHLQEVKGFRKEDRGYGTKVYEAFEVPIPWEWEGFEEPPRVVWNYDHAQKFDLVDLDAALAHAQIEEGRAEEKRVNLVIAAAAMRAREQEKTQELVYEPIEDGGSVSDLQVIGTIHAWIQKEVRALSV